MPPKKEERNKIVHYEQRKGAVPLSELCIQVSVTSSHLLTHSSLVDTSKMSINLETLAPSTWTRSARSSQRIANCELLFVTVINMQDARDCISLLFGRAHRAPHVRLHS